MSREVERPVVKDLMSHHWRECAAWADCKKAQGKKAQAHWLKSRMVVLVPRNWLPRQAKGVG